MSDRFTWQEGDVVLLEEEKPEGLQWSCSYPDCLFSSESPAIVDAHEARDHYQDDEEERG